MVNLDNPKGLKPYGKTNLPLTYTDSFSGLGLLEVEPRYLVHHPTIMLDVGEVLKSTFNTSNIIKLDYDLVPVTWKRLSDPDAWFLIAPQDQHDLSVYVRRSS